MEKELFAETGLKSIAWFIKVFKEHPGKRGHSFIRNDTIDGYTGDFPKLTKEVNALVAGGYLQKQGKVDSPRMTKYVVTSFGHRYLDQHKKDADPGPKLNVTERIVEANDRLIDKNKKITEKNIEKVSDLIGRQYPAGSSPQFKPSVPETPEQHRRRVGSASTFNQKSQEQENAPDNAFDTIQSPKARAVAEAMPVPTANSQPSDTGSDDVRIWPNNIAAVKERIYSEPEFALASEDASDTDALVKRLKTITGEILYDRHAKDVSVVDLIEKIESK